jgi:hypothetical protein
MTGLLTDFALSESGFIFDPRSGATFTVNVTGLTILEALREARDPRTIPGLLRERFVGVEEDVAEHVADFLRSLQQIGLARPEDGTRRGSLSFAQASPSREVRNPSEGSENETR